MDDTTMPATDVEQMDPAVDAPKPVDINDTIVKHFKAEAAVAVRSIKDRTKTWQRNIEMRVGTGEQRYSEGTQLEAENRAEISPDWSLTKTKTANLFSQVPEVRLTHENKQYMQAIPPFAKAMNYELGDKRANIGVAMEEVMNDVVNASGIGAIIVGYAARFEPVEILSMPTVPGPNGPMPSSQVPPEIIQQIKQQALANGLPSPTQMVDRPVSDKFYMTRISPRNLLIPKGFKGSNFDDGPWVGYKDECSWAEGKNEFKLQDTQREGAVGGTDQDDIDSLNVSEDPRDRDNEDKITYTDIYYWRYKVDPDEKSFKAIWRLVWVDGIDKPVIHEPWKGQQYDQQTRKYVGACKFPIQVLTLTYISDNPIPPSDTEAGRAQVVDMRRSRSQMFMNRKRSTPWRWVDSNRVDPLVLDLMMKGGYQDVVPTNGPGDRSLGEIARASYPPENMAFDQAVKNDLYESWQVGPNQNSSTAGGDTTKGEAELVQANFNTRIGQERGRVARFFLNCCEVLAGLMVLYSDFPTLTDQEKQQMQSVWDQKHILHDVVFKIRPDSTIVVDSQVRIDRLMKFLNMTIKSGFVNPLPILVEMAELSGLDPAEVITKPQPHVDAPKISYTFSGKDDMQNTMVMALMVAEGKAPTPDQIEQAKKLLQGAAQPPLGAELPPQPEMPNQPGSAPPSSPSSAGGPPRPMPPGQPMGPRPVPGPPPQPAGGLNAHPDWQLADKVAQRSRDIR